MTFIELLYLQNPLIALYELPPIYNLLGVIASKSKENFMEGGGQKNPPTQGSPLLKCVVSICHNMGIVCWGGEGVRTLARMVCALPSLFWQFQKHMKKIGSEKSAPRCPFDTFDVFMPYEIYVNKFK